MSSAAPSLNDWRSLLGLQQSADTFAQREYHAQDQAAQASCHSQLAQAQLGGLLGSFGNSFNPYNAAAYQQYREPLTPEQQAFVDMLYARIGMQEASGIPMSKAELAQYEREAEALR